MKTHSPEEGTASECVIEPRTTTTAQCTFVGLVERTNERNRYARRCQIIVLPHESRLIASHTLHGHGSDPSLTNETSNTATWAIGFQWSPCEPSCSFETPVPEDALASVRRVVFRKSIHRPWPRVVVSDCFFAQYSGGSRVRDETNSRPFHKSFLRALSLSLLDPPPSP